MNPRNSPAPVAVLTALLAILPAIAVMLPGVLASTRAQADPAPTPVTRSAKVSLAGVDLSTPAGAEEARRRLRVAARNLCSQVADSEDLSHQANYMACLDDSVSAALQRLPAPALAALAALEQTP